jgi:AraC-like DNA-binding protein
MELSIPWSELRMRPEKNLALGFDIMNDDRDKLPEGSYYAAWSGVEGGNLMNSSEWGNLVLAPGPRGPGLAAGLLALAAAGLGGFALFRLFRRRAVPLPTPLEKEEIKRAKEYIAQNYTREDMNREQVAQHVGLNPAYFSSLFKSETGTGFVEYLTKMRLQKAEELLRTSTQRISDIAFSVGFNSLEYFAVAFKKEKKMSPRDYRNPAQADSNKS